MLRLRETMGMKLSTAELKMIIDGCDAQYWEYHALYDLSCDMDISKVVYSKIEQVKRAQDFFEYTLDRCKNDTANVSLQLEQLYMAAEAVKARMRWYSKILENIKQDKELTRIVQECKSNTMELNTRLVREIVRLERRPGKERLRDELPSKTINLDKPPKMRKNGHDNRGDGGDGTYYTDVKTR